MTEPKFALNDRVHPLMPRQDAQAKSILGTVIKVYLHGGVYRYVVKFDDGKEEVFFQFEILSR
jgi:hypothetical protein